MRPPKAVPGCRPPSMRSSKTYIDWERVIDSACASVMFAVAFAIIVLASTGVYYILESAG